MKRPRMEGQPTRPTAAERFRAGVERALRLVGPAESSAFEYVDGGPIGEATDDYAELEG